MRQRRFLGWLALLALVAAQSLGLMHRVVHLPSSGVERAGGPARGHGETHRADADHAGAAHVHSPGVAAALFSSHDEGNQCRLFDPLHNDGALGLPVSALPMALSSHFLEFFQGECLARWAALYDARGPPLLR